MENPEKKPEVSALGISVVTNTPGDRGITIQTYIAADASIAEQNALIDRMMKILDRQKAKYELPSIKDEMELHEKTLARMEVDLKEVEHTFNRDQAKRRAELTALKRSLEEETEASLQRHAERAAALKRSIDDQERARKTAFDEGYNEWSASGRSGSYEPQGHRKVNLERMDTEMSTRQEAYAAHMASKDAQVGTETALVGKLIEDKQAEIDKATSERLQHQAQTEISRKRYKEEILFRKNKIARLKKVLAGEDAEE